MQTNELEIKNAYDTPFPAMTREQMYEAMAEIEEARLADTIAAEKARVLASVPSAALFLVEDPTVLSVLRRYETRSAEGMKAYGTSMSDNQSNLEFWLRSAQEEAMDLSLYLERAIDETQRQKEKKEPVHVSLPLIF